MKNFHAVTLLFTSLILVACGGGGGSAPGSNSSDTQPAVIWLVFRADKEVDGVPELYAVKNNGSEAPVKLSSQSIASRVSRYTVSPNGRFAAYLAREDGNSDGVFDAADGPEELFWISVDNSSPAIKVSGELPDHASIASFDWSPLSDGLVFRADIDKDNSDELYLVDSAASTAIKINGNIGATAEMGEVRWSPNGRFIAQIVRNGTQRYISDRIAINVYDRQVGGPNSTRLTGPNLPGSTFSSGIGSGANISGSVIWAPDSSRLAYMIDNRDNGTRIHYQAFPNGTNQRVTGTLAANENGGLNLSWSSDSRYLAYDVSTATIGSNIVEVFDTVNISVNRSVTAAPGGRLIARTDAIRWQPSGGNLIALAMSGSAGDPNRLVVVDATQTTVAPVPLSSPTTTDSVSIYRWSPNGAHLYYRSQNNTSSELYTLTPGAAPVKVSDPAANGRQTVIIDWLPNSTHLLYSFGNGHYVTTLNKTDEQVQVSGSLETLIPVNTVNFLSATVAPFYDSSQLGLIGMLALKPGTTTAALYTVTSEGKLLTEISGPMVTGGGVDSFAFAGPMIF